MKYTRFFVFIFILALAAAAAISWPGVSQAASRTWVDGLSNYLASEARNWGGSILPASGDALTLPAGSQVIWDLSGVVPASIASSAKVTLQAPLSTSGDLSINNDSFILNAQPLNVGGSLIINGGSLVPGASPVNVSGNWTFTSGTVALAANTVTLTGATAKAITSGGQHFGGLAVNAMGGTIAPADDLFVDNGLAITDGTLAISGKTLTVSNGINMTGGVLSVANGSIVFAGSVGRPFMLSGGVFTAGPASTVEYHPVSGSITIESLTYGNLTLDGNTMFSLAGETTVSSTLTVGANAILSPAGHVLSVSTGRLVNNGVIMDGMIHCPALSLSILDASGAALSSITNLSGNIIARVEDRDLNRKGNTEEIVNGLTITTMSGDKEYVSMEEGAPANGIFSTVGLVVHQGTTAQGNGQIEVTQNDIIFANYTDPQDPGDTKTVQVTVALSGVVITGTPQIVSGPRVMNFSGQNTGAGMVYSAHIIWSTDKVSTSAVSVSAAQLTSPITAGSLTGATSHDVTVTGLKRGVSYSFTVSSVTADGKSVNSSARQFIVIQPGDRIKTPTSAAVYWYLNEKRNVFPDATIYDSWFSDFNGVVTVPAVQMSDLPLGKNVPMRGGTYLIKIQSDPKTYAVEPLGKLRWIQTEAQAVTLYGANWNKRVRDVDVAQFVSYTVGDPIMGGEFPSGYLYQFAGGEWSAVVGNNTHLLTETGKTANGLSARFVNSILPRSVENLSSAAAYSGYAPDIDGVVMDGATIVVAPAFGS